MLIYININVSLCPHVPSRSGQLGSFAVSLQQYLKWAKSLNMKWVTMTRTARLCSKCMASFSLWINHTPLHVWTAGLQQMSRRKRPELNSERGVLEVDWMMNVWPSCTDISCDFFEGSKAPWWLWQHKHYCNLFLSIGCIPKSRTTIWARIWRFRLSHHFKLKPRYWVCFQVCGPL